MPNAIDAGLISSVVPSKRKFFARFSIAIGNALQLLGLTAACAVLGLAPRIHNEAFALGAIILSWLLLYFFCHAIAHWVVGRVLGIRFAFYTIGGTDHPEG